jgi:hypothetical protein
MNKVELKRKQMLKFFNLKKCITLEDLCESLNYTSRSVQRLLKAVGYYSSFTHNGKWYTLNTTPEFDDNGLWFYMGIGFSQFRSLNTTIIYLIDSSEKGLLAIDLSTTLSTSCPPVLNRLYKMNKIDRAKTPKGFVYISIDNNIKVRQVSCLEKKRRLKRPSETDIITILVEFIRNPDRSFEELSLYLNRRDFFCSPDTINNLFVYFGLEKKIPKMSKSSL